MNPELVLQLLKLGQTLMTTLATAPPVPVGTLPGIPLIPPAPVNPLGFPSPIDASDAGASAGQQAAGGDDVIRLVQCLLGVPEDGLWGPQTRAAVLALKARLGI